MEKNSKKYLLTALPDKGWSWERYSVVNLAEGSSEDVFFFVSALGQGLAQIEQHWKIKKDRKQILEWMDSCLIHCFGAMVKTTNELRRDMFSGWVSFLMNFIESFRIYHKMPSSDVVVRIWAESLKKMKE